VRQRSGGGEGAAVDADEFIEGGRIDGAEPTADAAGVLQIFLTQGAYHVRATPEVRRELHMSANCKRTAGYSITHQDTCGLLAARAELAGTRVGSIALATDCDALAASPAPSLVKLLWFIDGGGPNIVGSRKIVAGDPRRIATFAVVRHLEGDQQANRQRTKKLHDTVRKLL